MKTVLLVSPAFHGYWRPITEAIGRRGYDVTPFAYDAFYGLPAKTRNKVSYELPEKFRIDRSAARQGEFTDRAVARVRELRPDIVVTIKGDTLGDDYWSAVEEIGAARVTWFYDELRRMHHPADRLAQIGPIASYSPLDVAALVGRGIRADHVPLAFDHTLVEIDPATRNDEVVFIGARYPQREIDLVALSDAGLPVRAFGRDWSRQPFDRLRTWSWHRPRIPAERDLTRADAYVEQAAAAAVLNTHGDQDGFTMRTFEASGVGGLQLIDRPDVGDLYEPGTEIVVFENEAELIDAARRARTDAAWADRIRAAGRRRTLAEHTFDHRAAKLEALWD